MGLDRLTEAGIKKMCSGRAYSRGAACYRSGRVTSARLVGGAVEATVKDGAARKIEAAAEGGRGRRAVSCACTCPYSREGLCEHAVAVLLHTMDHYQDMADRAGWGALSPARLVGKADEKYARRFLASGLAADADLALRFARGLGAPPPTGLDYGRWINALLGEGLVAEAATHGIPLDAYVELDCVMEAVAELEKAGEFTEAARAYGQIAKSLDVHEGYSYIFVEPDTVRSEAMERRAECLAKAGRPGGRRARAR